MVVWIILGLVLCLIGGLLLRAAVFKAPKEEDVPFPEEAVDAQRALTHLSQAIQIPTVSHWEDDRVDWSQFERFHGFLEQAFPRIHQTLKREVVSKASLLYTWQGRDPGLEPIALLSHMDVVPVSEGTEQDWTHPPFAGVNDGESLWGRGAMDMKNHLVAMMESVETLLEEGFQPERTVYLCLGHNEEIVASPHNGAKALREVLQSRGVHLEAVIDEGSVLLPVDTMGIRTCLCPVGVTEKGYADIKVTVSAKGGHSSVPPKHTALGRLAQIIQKIEKHPFRARLIGPIRELAETAGRHMPFYLRIVLANLWFFQPLLLWILKSIPSTASVVRSTIAVTQAQGSPAANVLPQKASATINFRIMPGESVASVVEHLRKVIHDDSVEVEVVKCKEPSPISSTQSRGFRTIRTLCRQERADAVTMPLMVMGGTDAYNYEPICDHVYRFSPFVASPELLHCTHATNERLPVASMKGAVTFFKRYIRLMAAREEKD